ncbi:hypothetical protein TNCV_2452081 [Trichonephila clavipes]|nr:hypothetical protein TNCV_2452081 [Trichonephila clavipes]
MLAPQEPGDVHRQADQRLRFIVKEAIRWLFGSSEQDDDEPRASVFLRVYGASYIAPLRERAESMEDLTTLLNEPSLAPDARCGEYYWALEERHKFVS